jgi:Tol biopolymer transport system component
MIAMRVSLFSAGLLTLAALNCASGATLPLQPTRKIEFDTDEGTWMSLDLSNDGRTIVFDLLGDLYTIPVDGGTARALTSGLAFDSQPAFSPDGALIVFLSDRSGAENLWVVRADGSQPRQVSFPDDYDTFVSPAWSADGKTLYVSRHRADLNGYELWKFDAAGKSEGERLAAVKSSIDQPRDQWRSVLGVAPSSDGRFLYYAEHIGDMEFSKVPEWTLRRRDLGTGRDETIVSAPKSPRPDLSLGSVFRPAVSPDGRWLAYATRYDGRTALRLLDLDTRQDRWLSYPIQQDELQSFASRDLLPRYDFTPDGKALIISVDGKFRRLDIASGASTAIPFNAHVAVDVGPALRVDIKQETGPVRARLIQTPTQSPDGRHLAFSALGFLYVMALDRPSIPRRLIPGDATQFQPSWSPDGRSLVYVTWTARDAGHIWSVPSDGRGQPRRLTEIPAFYTNPVFTPDGQSVIAVRSSNAVRMHSYMEYGNLRQGELVKLPASGGASEVITQGFLGGQPQFTAEAGCVYLNFADGLNRVALDGSGKRRVLAALGPGWYFAEGPAPVDDLRISPDGHWALAQIAQQLHVLAVPDATAPDDKRTIDLSRPTVAHRKLTDVGADFFDWADGGRTITWAVGSTFYRRPFASVVLDAPNAPTGTADAPKPGQRGVKSFEAIVEVPRDVPKGTIVLRGATVIPMKGDEVIADADVVIVDDHIAAVGERGQIKIPSGATIHDVRGKFIVPGFIDTHDHLADIRRGVFDLASWGALSNLAYGVTTAFDPSPLSIDMLAYEDLVDSGRMLGSRIHSTGPALFSFNEFKSQQEVLSVLSRYSQHYRTRNLKEYRTGNRRVRQWVAAAARELHLMPTTEGALSMKLDLTQIMDGYAGNEHALTTLPLSNDVIQLVAQSKVSYTLTLLITNGGPEAQDYYIAKAQPHDDPKLNRFSPHYVIDIKTLERTWRDPREYAFPRIAESAAKIARAGGLLGVGSHGEMPGIGFHWEMQAYASGGMTPREVLHAATLGSAETIGRQAQFGSIEPGKYADLVVLDKNPLDNIANTLSVREVMKNGRLYDGDTLDELWPRQRPLPPLWFWSDRPPEHEPVH